MEMFTTLVLQVVLAVVVANLTWAGYRSQKWWERKAELCARPVEKIYGIQNNNSHTNSHINTDPTQWREEQRASQQTD